MAKSYYSCAECNASVTIIGRNRSEADRRAKWHESQGSICADCLEKQRAEEAVIAAQNNRASGLPVLTGSEKQVAWAETLRGEILGLYDQAITLLDTETVEALDERPYAETAVVRRLIDELTQVFRGDLDAARKLRNCIACKTEAHWWIERRAASVRALSVELNAELSAPLIPATPSELEIAALAETILRPVGTALTEIVAEISIRNDVLRVSFGLKHDAFIEVMHRDKFVWRNGIWQLQLGVTTGSPTDRIAETAHHLIAAGFVVRVYDPEGRAKAISGEFDPAFRNWVTLQGSGLYQGWFRIVWDGDFYEQAKRILGARYHDGGIHAPKGSAEEVVDFAESYGFRFSPVAMQLIEEHRALMAKGTIIDAPKRPPKPKSAVAPSAPNALHVTSFGVDHALLDDN